jgi:hypothetical protein
MLCQLTLGTKIKSACPLSSGLTALIIAPTLTSKLRTKLRLTWTVRLANGNVSLPNSTGADK